MQKRNQLFLFILASALMVISYLPSIYHYHNSHYVVGQFQEILREKESNIKNYLSKIHQLDREGGLYEVDKSLRDQYQNQGFSYFIFHQGQLNYWSEDATAIQDSLLLGDSGLIVSGNGLHERVSYRVNDSLYLGLILVANQYSYENRFLKNEFQKDFQFSGIRSIAEVDKGDTNIVGEDGRNLFSLKLNKERSTLSTFQYVLGLAGVLAFIIWLVVFPKLFFERGVKYHLSAIFIGIGFRLLFFWKLPHVWQDWELFQPKWFAISSWIPTLGDFVLHLVVLFYISYHWKNLRTFWRIKYLALIEIFIASLLAFQSVEWISKSVTNSIINYNLNNLLKLSELSYLSFLCFGIFFLITILLFDLSLKRLYKKYSKSKLVLVFLLSQVVWAFIFYLSVELKLAHFWLLIPFFVFVSKYHFQWQRSLGAPILLLLTFSLLTAHTIDQVLRTKQADKQELILQKLAEEKDPVAEYLFVELQDEMLKDHKLKKLISDFWERQEEAESYLKQNYFNGFWEKYTIVFTPCKKEDSLYVSTGDTYTSCREYFLGRLKREGELISSTNFFQLQNFPGQIEYLAEIDIPIDSTNYSLYIELSSNFLNENEGYPELLLDAQSKAGNLDLSDYSYAIYENGNLVYHHGAYNYTNQLKITELGAGSFFKYSCENNEHLAYQKDDSTTLLLSKPVPGMVSFFTSLAYLFVLFSIMFGLVAMSLRGFPFHFNFSLTDFSSKIQIFLIGSLLISLVLFSLGTTYYIQEQYQKKNFNNLSEKLRSVNVELEQKIGTEEFLAEPLQPYISGLLIKFSNVFYTDINLYDKNGRLYASSRPEVFEKGLKSKRMDPLAYSGLIIDQKSEWVQEETIGEMNYLSAYIPFRNYENEVLAYLNLPYFSKQDELQEEISTFLVSTINIYVGIFTLALLVSVLLINQLSKPLLLIRRQIGRLKLGSSVELIDWNSQDEIGALVQEYNRIAIELNESAEQLAQSEREGAWHEMAKQVAHEIKNPLTPMKLSIQHLQRSSEGNPEELKERLQRTTQTLIEQIDTLSNIANAFSTFAKLPGKELQPLDLIPLLNNITHLYDQEVNISFENLSGEEKAIVSGDKDHLLRLFNNLIKNAIYAIQEVDNGRVEVRLKYLKKNFMIEVEDNGIGIPEKEQARIFEPNFTTKSSGTGLGLAMAKNIVKHMHGKISFKSTEGQGTVFSIRLKSLNAH